MQYLLVVYDSGSSVRSILNAGLHLYFCDTADTGQPLFIWADPDIATVTVPAGVALMPGWRTVRPEDHITGGPAVRIVEYRRN